MEIDQQITAAIQTAVEDLYHVSLTPRQLSLTPTRKEFEGHLTLMVFPFLKQTGVRNPEDLGRAIGDYLLAHCPVVSAYNVIKGFLNLSVTSTSWVERLETMRRTPHYGCKEVTAEAPLVMIEYASPNTNKPLHLGHLRNILLGWSLAKILGAAGNRVVKTNIVNDRGIHICKSMLAWQKWACGVTPESLGKKGDHLIGDCYVAFDRHFKAEVADALVFNADVQALTVSNDKGEVDTEKTAEARKAAAEAASPLMQEARAMLRKWEAGDEDTRALWRKMNQWVYDGFDETYKMMGVTFDKIYYESDTYLQGKELVLKGLSEGLFLRKDDGSVWADFTSEGLDQKILLRSDGTSVYMTQDIGTAKLRYEDYPDISKMIYVVGNEQNYHFQVLALLLDRLGFSWGKDLVHFSYGMVELPNGRMKSREGTVVDADDLMASMIDDARAASTDRLEGLTEAEREEVFRQIGLGALKYFLLKVNPVNNMVFNPAESIDFNGNTGPFIQYTHARICSLLAKAGLPSYPAADTAFTVAKDVEVTAKEQTLIQKLADLPSLVERASRELSPAVLANYAYDLAKEYNQFYHDTPILKESDADKRALRLALSQEVAYVICTTMDLLGIEVPERM